MTGGPGDPRSRNDDEWASAGRTPAPQRGSRPDARAERVDEAEYDDVDDDAGRPSRRPRAYSQHLGGPDGPDWERPRRYEAYPTIKSRVGLPRVRGVPPLLLAAVLVVVLAIALLFLPGLLNFGGGTGVGASAAPSGSAQPSVSIGPSVAPQPTAQLYTIKKGDTLSKVATSFGITIEELLAANPTIKNPNKVGLGQEIVIPVPSEPPPDTVGESPAPSA
jgi:hypothetical protein